MNKLILVNYSVGGIKTLEKKISLSFYKKTYRKGDNVAGYNVKGIYGMNGSGKSAIVTSVIILKNLLINPGYLNNPLVQKNLDEMVNKKRQELVIEVDFLSIVDDATELYRYKVIVARDDAGKFTIRYENMMIRPYSANKENWNTVFEVKNGSIIKVARNTDIIFEEEIKSKTVNILGKVSLCSIFMEKYFSRKIEVSDNNGKLFQGLCELFFLGEQLQVYMDKSDDHTDYFLCDYLYLDNKDNKSGISEFLKNLIEKNKEQLSVVSVGQNRLLKSQYEMFEETVKKMCSFIRIFKNDLLDIDIEKKEDKDSYICNLVMVYKDYSISAEFESSGIKKLINLYVYLNEMVNGGIVFIDEFDSNLHDVYLCALLEYLMEYGTGQLCFTTHNVGPMDILKKNKKSIDFLSVDQTIYQWTKSGNYSPSKLYRGGMIEGSPFNVDSIDFIGVFESKGDN